MAAHSSILAWETPWTEEPGGLQFMGSQRVGHDWVQMYASIVEKKNMERKVGRQECGDSVISGRVGEEGFSG